MDSRTGAEADERFRDMRADEARAARRWSAEVTEVGALWATEGTNFRADRKEY